MAKILYGEGVMAISGTIGGTTHQKWRSIDVIRKKPTPHNPSTPRQTRIRSIVSTISRAWRDVLNQGQRKAWEQFAENFPWFDVFGKALMLRGISLFLKMNTVLLDHDLAMQLTPPPAVEPPELTDVINVPEVENLHLTWAQLDPGIVTAQASFLDIWVAGGFVSSDIDISTEVTVNINSSCLPQGRTHQKSDFRHVVYAPDVPVSEPVSVNSIQVIPPALNTKNVVVRVQRYNKYGRFSVPVIFSGIRTGA